MTPRQQEIEASRAEWAYYRLALRTAEQPGNWPPPRPQEQPEKK